MLLYNESMHGWKAVENRNALLQGSPNFYVSARPPHRLRSVMEIRSQSLKLLTSTEKWKAGHHVTPCLCHAATLKTIYNIIICHTHTHIIELTHTVYCKLSEAHTSALKLTFLGSGANQHAPAVCHHMVRELAYTMQYQNNIIRYSTSNLYQTSFCCIDHHMTQVSHKPKKSLATTRGPGLGNLQGFSKGGFWMLLAPNSARLIEV